MSKTAINNEIILMRQAVRKSSVSVIRKLIKEAKLLKAREHGNGKILKKCKRKAERLIAEIEAAKKIKDDDVSKFGLMDTRSLQEILNDTTVEPNTRIMARLAFHKFLQDKILKFKEKFPSYQEFLGPGKKKMSKLQKMAKREARNPARHIGEEVNQSDNQVQLEKVNEAVSEEAADINDTNNEGKSVDSEVGESLEDDETNDEPLQDILTKNDPELGSILGTKTSKLTTKEMGKNVQNQSKVCARLKHRDEVKGSKKRKVATNSPLGAKRSVPIRVISEEATVKRFTDLIEKKESLEIVEEQVTGKNLRKGVIIEKQVDSFFMLENGESEYMSVVVPKSEHCEDEDHGDHRNHGTKRQKTFHEKNNKFFNKIDQFNNSDYANRSTLNLNKRSRSDGRFMERFPRSEKDNIEKSRKVKPGFEKKHDVKEEELHPSWQARKKQQEILKQGFQGKKIVFDD